MILIFEPESPYIKWYKVEGANSVSGKCQFTNELFEKILCDEKSHKDIKAIGYHLYHGGEDISKTIDKISLEDIPKLENCVKYLPDYNDLTLKIAELGTTIFPSVPQFLFCDTAFYSDLPHEASVYAVPKELTRQGIRRYGGYGLFHQYAWENIKLLCGASCEKIISIYIGNHTNITAIKNGIPLETTIGFTPVEGIISNTSCGDIDPTIIFQLNSEGMSFEEINELLARESGFSGLLGYKCSFSDLINDKDDVEKAKIIELLQYNITKYIGAYISVLGGIDGIIFIVENLKETMKFINIVCTKLKYLDLELKMNLIEKKNIIDLTEVSSKVKVFTMETNRYKIELEIIKSLTN